MKLVRLLHPVNDISHRFQAANDWPYRVTRVSSGPKAEGIRRF